MKKGFTLIELSIVLVIIGMIAGGVLVGQDLISAAAVRAQISQIEKYNTAVNTFQGKYGYLPGDIPNPVATQYGFGARGAFAGQGDGNGLLEGVGANAAGRNNGFTFFSGEMEMFWPDLTTAKLIDGGFSQNNMLAPPASVTATQVSNYFPAAKIGNGNYLYVWSGGWGVMSGPGDRTNYFGLSVVIGSPAALNGEMASKVSLTVQQAYAIDSKIDDGMPQSGRVMAQYPGAGAQWAAGGSDDPVLGSVIYGDYDADTWGPITPQTVNPHYATDNGATLDQTCYNNGHTLAPEHYSMEYNNGNGQNCALSFQFQ